MQKKLKMKKHLYIIIPLFLFINICYAQVSLILQTGHSTQIADLCFSNDNNYLASAGKEGNIVIWDLKTGRQFASLTGHHQEVTSICFHPLKQILATASNDSTVLFWNYITGKIINKLNLFTDKITSISYNYDGSQLFVCSNSLYIINTETFEIINKLSDYNYLKAINSKSGYCFSAKNSKSSFLASREGINSIESKHLKAKLYFALKKDDGLTIYTSGKNGNELVSYSYNNSRYEKSSKTFEQYNKFKILAITTSKSYVAFADRKKIIYVYGENKKNKVYQFAGHISLPTNLTISSDEKWLASADESGMIFLWDLKTGNLIKVLQAKLNAVADARISANQEKVSIL